MTKAFSDHKFSVNEEVVFSQNYGQRPKREHGKVKRILDGDSVLVRTFDYYTQYFNYFCLKVAVKIQDGRFTFSAVWFIIHTSQLLSVDNVVLFSGPTFVLGGAEGIRAMKTRVHVCSWMQFSVCGNEVKLREGDFIRISEHTVMIAGFQRTSHSDTYAYFLVHMEGEVSFIILYLLL